MLGDTDDRTDISGQCYEELLLDIWVDSPISWWLNETLLPVVVIDHAENSNPEQDDASSNVLLLDTAWNEDAFPSAPPSQKAVLFCPLLGQVCNLKWWLTKNSTNHVDICHMYAEMGNDESREMKLKLQKSWIPSVFVTPPKVGGTDINLMASTNAVITQKFLVISEQPQAFACAVQLGYNWVSHTWLLHTSPGGDENHTRDRHQHCWVVKLRVPVSLMSRQKIAMLMI